MQLNIKIFNNGFWWDCKFNFFKHICFSSLSSTGSDIRGMALSGCCFGCIFTPDCRLEHEEAELTVTAFRNALIRRQPAPGLIFHSDRGAQYCSNRFQSLLKGTGGLQSMSGTGCCSDNAVTESFFGTLKRELVHCCSFSSRGEAQSRIFHYIEACYNRQRRHSAVSYQAPENYERLFFNRAA